MSRKNKEKYNKNNMLKILDLVAGLLSNKNLSDNSQKTLALVRKTMRLRVETRKRRIKQAARIRSIKFRRAYNEKMRAYDNIRTAEDYAKYVATYYKKAI